MFSYIVSNIPTFRNLPGGFGGQSEQRPHSRRDEDEPLVSNQRRFGMKEGAEFTPGRQ